MMVNLGIDFGSTYTMVSVMDGEEPKMDCHTAIHL